MSGGRLLTVRNLRVVYPGDDGDFRAVRNVSFSLGRERLGIFIVSLGFNLLGDGLRDVADSRAG